MIVELSEKWAIDPMLKMITDREDVFKISEDKLKTYFDHAINNESCIILLDQKDDKVNGFVYASVEEFNGEDVCFIHCCVVIPEMKYTVHDFIARLRKWSAEKGLKIMIMSTDKHEKGFEKKYGFRYVSTLMSISVNK